MIQRLLNWLLIFSISLTSLLVLPQSAQAFVAEAGTFIASDRCPGLSSIRRQTNPGNININPGNSYPLLGKNKQDATHYQIQIEGADPVARWVEVSCGSINTNNIDVSPDPGSTPTNFDYLLAASWQPGFCETKPDKPECASQMVNDFSATHLAIHGLWPQPRSNVYCNVPSALKQLDKDRRWLELPELDLSPALRQDLAIKMPGYRSGLHLHEWYKHGTCYSETPEEYYQETIALLDQLNRSEVRTVLAQNLEQDISDAQLEQAFNTAFGVMDKVTLRCKRVNGENLIQELWINLKGEITPETDIATLLAAAPDAANQCLVGEVDSVDEQPFEGMINPAETEAKPIVVNRLDDGRLQILIDPEQI